MSKFEPDGIAEEERALQSPEPTAADEASARDAACVPSGPRWKRVMKRVFIGIGITLIVLVAVAALLYNFGGMWVRTPEMKASFDELVASGQAEPVKYRFTIPVPGCTCHSDDPVLQAKHSVRHVKDCMKCHNTDPAREVPGL